MAGSLQHLPEVHKDLDSLWRWCRAASAWLSQMMSAEGTIESERLQSKRLARVDTTGNVPSGIGGVPAGTIIGYPASNPPEGWLVCNGQAVPRVMYPLLFNAIGTSFGVGDGSTTFNLPNTKRSGPLLYVRDEKANATSAGGFTSGAWQTRTLNTVAVNEIAGASLAANQITLPAGTYCIQARAPAYQVDTHIAKLRNVTDASDTIIGANSRSGAGAGELCESFVLGHFTITAQKTFELQHRCLTTKAVDGFGIPMGFGVVEVYAEVRIEQLLLGIIKA